MVKTERFAGHNIDLERLTTRVETYLQENGFEVAFSKDPAVPAAWFFIQARKAGALRTVAGARRSTDIAIRGGPSSFEVSIGTGEWGKNMVMSLPLFIVPAVGIAATVAKFYAGKKFESNLWKYIRDQIMFLSNSSVGRTAKSDTRAYDCDYVEGYPGWKSQVGGGKLMLERARDGKNRIVFSGGASEMIVIPAENVMSAQIVSRKGLHGHDLMIQIACRDQQGRTIKPVFNLNDDIIRGVFAGITELVGEDKALRELEHASVVTEVRFCTACGAQNPRNAKFCTECGARQS
jgi:hypothetical protein